MDSPSGQRVHRPEECVFVFLAALVSEIGVEFCELRPYLVLGRSVGETMLDHSSEGRLWVLGPER